MRTKKRETTVKVLLYKKIVVVFIQLALMGHSILADSSQGNTTRANWNE